MRILIVSNLYPPLHLGGYGILCKQVCDELRARGHEVRVLTSTHGLQHAAAPEPDSTTVVRRLRLERPFSEPAPRARFRRWHTGRYNELVATEVLAGMRPDLVFVWSQLRLTLGAARAAHEFGVPVVYTFNDDHLSGYVPARPGARPRQALRYVADRWLFPGISLRGLDFSHSTCISKLVRDRLILAGAPVQPSRVIYQGIPIERFPMKDEPGSLHTPVRVLYTGQLHSYKGVHAFVQGVHELASELGGGSVLARVAGTGPPDYERELRNLADSGPARVEFLGRVAYDRLSAVYRDHDVFVFPSEWQEAFGLTHLESMASGTPVISTIAGGQREFLQHGRNALVFEAGNVRELAQRLHQLVTDDALRRRLVRCGRETVETRFTLARYVTDLERLLEEPLEIPCTSSKSPAVSPGMTGEERKPSSWKRANAS